MVSCDWLAADVTLAVIIGQCYNCFETINSLCLDWESDYTRNEKLGYNIRYLKQRQ